MGRLYRRDASTDAAYSSWRMRVVEVEDRPLSLPSWALGGSWPYTLVLGCARFQPHLFRIGGATVRYLPSAEVFAKTPSDAKAVATQCRSS